MQPELNAKLEKLRQRLMEMHGNTSAAEGDETAWGPDDMDDDDHLDASAAGDGGAVNASEVNDVFEDYLLSIMDSILEDFDMNDEDLMDVIFDVAASCAEDGSLPEMPAEGDLSGTAEWVGKARSLGFSDLVYAVVESDAESE